MDRLLEEQDRRTLLRRVGGWGTAVAIGPMLAACGDGGPRSTTMPVLTDDARRLNLALNIGYLGAEYHSRAAGGAGIPIGMRNGVGRPGSALGVRIVSFSEPAVAAMAGDIGADKIARISTLRRQAGTAAAAMPTLDLSSVPGAAFTTVARAALPSSVTFDPYASDDNFLLGAFILDDGTAATLRGLSRGATVAETSALLDEAAADATYHAALVRTLIEQRSVANPALLDAASRLRGVLSEIGCADVEGLAHDRYSANGIGPFEPAGSAFPFMRSPAQALQSLFLNAGQQGGFLPYGANGMA